jgi:hypothetical protein
VPYSSDKWVTSPGEDRYRRSLYTMWRRTSPYPSMTTFDAPSGELCALRRIPTNTPLQALVALNDPVALDAAQRMAERILTEAGENASVEERLAYAFELVLIRPPRQEEVDRLRNLYHQMQASLERDTDSALDLRNFSRTIYREDRLEWIVGGPDEEPGSWQYTTTQAGPNWTSRDFDDSGWTEGRGMFGFVPEPAEGKDPSKYAKRIGTDWKSESILLRREFDVSAHGLEDLRIHVNYLGEFQIYFNGVLAAETEEDTAGAKDLIPSDRATATIRPGHNVVAVHAAPERAAENGQYIDVRLSAARPPSFAASADDSHRAAWVIVSHVLLNLDETLTKR